MNQEAIDQAMLAIGHHRNPAECIPRQPSWVDPCHSDQTSLDGHLIQTRTFITFWLFSESGHKAEDSRIRRNSMILRPIVRTWVGSLELYDQYVSVATL